MAMRSGDAVKVWLNGNVVHREAAESLGCREIDVPLACNPQVCISDPELEPGAEGGRSWGTKSCSSCRRRSLQWRLQQQGTSRSCDAKNWQQFAIG